MMKKFPVVNFIAALIVSLYCASFSDAVAATEASPSGISAEATANKKNSSFSDWLRSKLNHETKTDSATNPLQVAEPVATTPKVEAKVVKPKKRVEKNRERRRAKKQDSLLIAEANAAEVAANSEILSAASQDAGAEAGTVAEADSGLKNWFEKNSASRTEKTAGHLVGVDFILTDVKFNERYTRNTRRVPINTQPFYSGYGFGGGVVYKYAFNFDGLFIAPGIFFEKNNTTVNGNGADSLERIDINQRLGLRSDLGYDVTKWFAPYLTGGYDRISYTTQNYSGSGANTRSYIKSSHAWDWYYGAGFKIRINNNVAFNFEYNRESFLAKTLVVNTVNYMSYYKTNLNIYKAGLSYNF